MMRGVGEVRQKLKQAQYRHVKRILRDRFPAGEDWPKEEVEQIKDEYREFFAASPIHIIAKDFPDVAALMWVLEEQPDQPLAVNGTLVGRMDGVMLWADSDMEADRARVIIDRIVEAATESDSEPEITLPVPVPVRKSWWQRLFG
jgi:hypothetical protein